MKLIRKNSAPIQLSFHWESNVLYFDKKLCVYITNFKMPSQMLIFISVRLR